MKVAFVSVVPSPYQRDFFHALARRVDLEVFYLEAAAPDSPWPEKALAPYEHVLPGFWLALRGARFHINWRLPDVGRFDVVVMNTLMSLAAQWMMRGPLRTKPWAFWGERLTRRGGWHDRLSAPLHRATAIAAIGSVAQRDYRDRFPEPRSHCIPYHCDLAPFLAETRNETREELVFLLCGQMIARKGVDLLLTAFARLNGARLLLVGREAELPQLLSALPQSVRDRIEYAGFQPPEVLPHFFARADVFVLPSRYDGWGVVVNQALGAGLPVICSDSVGAGSDLIAEERNGLRFATGDAVALERAMRRFIDEPTIIGPWGEASRAKAHTISPECGAEKWVEVFRQIGAP